MKQKAIVIAILIINMLGGCAKETQPPAADANEQLQTDTQENLEETDQQEKNWGQIEEYDLEEYDNPYNTHHHLDVATYITKIDGMYFINDCYHDQVIFHDNLEDDITYWHILTDEVHYAHTIASDGIVYLVDDTENNRVLVFQKMEDKYVHTQTFSDIGQWPHYIQYVEELDCFYAWSSVTGEMFIFKRDAESNHVYLADKKQIMELFGMYIRSFSIIDGDLYFVSGHGNSKIVVADLETFEVKKEYPVPAQIAGMAQIYKIEDDYYITVSTDNEENQDCATLIRTKDLSKLMDGEYEDLYDQFTDQMGTPYYINEIEGTFYMTNHRTDEHIYSFKVKDGIISDIKVVY